MQMIQPRTLGKGIVKHASDALSVECPCGLSTRVVTQADNVGCSLHITEIINSVKHYHLDTTEVYYILEGDGQIELDGEWFQVRPGSTITIPPGTRHRLVSETGIRTIVFALPAFNASDEYFDENLI